MLLFIKNLSDRPKFRASDKHNVYAFLLLIAQFVSDFFTFHSKIVSVGYPWYPLLDITAEFFTASSCAV